MKDSPGNGDAVNSRAERPARELLLRAAQRKAKESASTIERFFDVEGERIVACAEALAQRLGTGGRLWTFGNGGSACDAAHASVEFCHPVFDKRRAFPAIALSSDVALLTAIANDQDFTLVLERQIRLQGRPGDAALGISTSGKSANVLRALKAARGQGLFTIGLGGRDGGALVDVCDFAFVAPSYSIHRIQETHVAFIHVLWDLVHLTLGEEDIL